METMNPAGALGGQAKVRTPERTVKRAKGNVIWPVVALFGLISATAVGSGIYKAGANSRDKEVAALETTVHDTTVTALALGRAGFTNVVDLQMPERGTALATLSADATNPNACTITFYVGHGPGGEPQLTLHQRDASGHEYGTATATTGAAAHNIVADLCN